MIWQAKNTKNDIEEIKPTKTQTGKQSQSRVPTGNKEKKKPTKLTNMVKKRKEGNERKEK